MSFENTTELFPGLVGTTSPEELARIRAEKAEEKERADAILAAERARQAKERQIADKESQKRAAEILEKEAIEICMSANPSMSWHEAKSLYDHELKEIIQIERFKLAFFGSSDTKQRFFGSVKM